MPAQRPLGKQCNLRTGARFGEDGDSRLAAVARLFAAIAPRYDLMNRLMTGRMDLAWRRRACALLEPLPHGDAPILDVGTGTADLALTLAQRWPDIPITGVDLTQEMLALGRRKVAARRVDGQIALVRGNALALPYPDASFAAVVSAFTLRNLADPLQALAEMRRVVVPGGCVLCLELAQPTAPGFCTLFRFYFTHLVPILGALVARSRAAYTYLPASVEAFPPPATLAQAMIDAGLRDVRWERLALGAATIHVGRR